MIDGVKIEIISPGLHERLLQDEELTFHRGRDRYTSEKYHNLVFILYDSGRVEIRGSLHKYWNQGAHNYNDFTRVDLWDTIHELCQRLQIEPAEAVLHNLEFGVNLSVPFSPSELLRDLIAYKSYPFGRVSVPNSSTYYQARNFDCYVKCYDKGAQYGRPENLLRFEIKVKSMRFLHRAGVKTLEDLMKAEKIATLGVMLSEAWQLVLIRERLPAAELTTKEGQVVETVTTTDLNKLDRRRRNELIKKYRAIVERTLYGNNRKKTVTALICDKWEQLTKGGICKDLAAHPQQPAANPENPDVCNDLQHVAETPKTGRMQRLSIDCIRPGNQTELFTFTAPPTPPATATLMTMTTAAADGCRIKKRKRDYHTEKYYISHNRRNARSNPANNLRRRVRRAITHTTLFDPQEVIRLMPDQIRQLRYFDGSARQMHF